jgi:lipopolysaccharide export system protein LptA
MIVLRGGSINRLLWMGVFSGFFWGWPVASPLMAQGKSEVEIKADKLQIDAESRQAVFTGHVRFSYDGVQFGCERLLIRYDEQGAPLFLTATGKVSIRQQGTLAEAARAEMTMKTGVVVLSGNPRVVRDRNTLSGKTVRLNVRTGEVEVAEAVGTFVFPGKAGVSP